MFGPFYSLDKEAKARHLMTPLFFPLGPCPFTYQFKMFLLFCKENKEGSGTPHMPAQVLNETP